MGQDGIHRRGPGLILLAALLAVIGSASSAPAATSLEIALDATDIGRKLVHSVVTITEGEATLPVLYPKWIRGIHGPTGPINNVGGFVVKDATGSPIPWERDYADAYRFNIDASSSQYPVSIALTYICNPSGWEPSATPTMGVINWSAVSVYPEGIAVRDIMVTPRLILPGGWKYATAMPVKDTRGDTVIFQSVTYEQLLDYPIICGLHFKSIQLKSTPSSDYFVHVVVDEDYLLSLIDSAFAQPGWNKLARETEALFGRTHFDSYHYLVAISDSIPHYGLEHRNSSVNSTGLRSLTAYGEKDFFLQWVLPHEFVHAWCGKYRRPAGMNTPDYQTPKDMQLLWVYEGLTSYLGMILYARTGLTSTDYFMEDVAKWWGKLRFTTGRQWRSLHDVAVSTHTVWGGSDNWKFLRRGADYYPEGAMLWLEIDARLRDMSGGSKSLDDFCRSFFGRGDVKAHSIPYTRDDLVSALSELGNYGWDSLITARISGVSPTLDETPLRIAGYEFGFTNQKPSLVGYSEDTDECRYYYASLGLAIADAEQKVLQIVPDSPADKAGLCTGMTVVGVNGKTFSFDRLEKAIRDAADTGSLTLLTRHGELIQNHDVNYGGGLRWLKLQPLDGQTRWLDSIIAPQVAQ
jgi:predicted metalloprotease with PDZ domain